MTRTIVRPIPLSVFRYRVGDSIPAAGGVFTRAGEAVYQDSAGVWRLALTDVPRDDHYIGGTRYLLLETAARINSVRNNYNYQSTGTAEWVTDAGTGTITVESVAADIAAAGLTDLVPDGFALKLTNTGGVAFDVRNLGAVAVGDQRAGAFIKATGAGGRLVLGNTTVASFAVGRTFATGFLTGARLGGSGTAPFHVVVDVGGTVWVVLATGVAVAAGAEVGHVLPIRNATGGPVTQAADLLYFPVHPRLRPGELSLYARFREAGSLAASGVVLYLGGAGDTGVRARLRRLSTDTRYGCAYHNGTTDVTKPVPSGEPPGFGQLVELRGVIGPTCAVSVGQKLQGTTEVVSTASAGNTPTPAFGANRLYVGSAGGSSGSVLALLEARVLVRTQAMASLSTTTALPVVQAAKYDMALEAAGLGLTTAQTAQLAQLTDFSGQARHLAAGSATLGTLQHDGTRWFCRLPLGAFYKSAAWASIPQPFTVFMVGRTHTQNEDDQTWLAGIAGGQVFKLVRSVSDAGATATPRFQFRGSSGALASPGTIHGDDSSFLLIRATANGVRSDMWKNGLENYGRWNIGTDAMGGLSVGAESGGTVQGLVDVVAIWVVPGVDPDEIVSTAETTLLALGGITPTAYPLASSFQPAGVEDAGGTCPVDMMGDADGRLDLVCAESESSEVFWLEQLGDEDWVKWMINSSGSYYTKIESVLIADFKGDGSKIVLALDQELGTIIVHTPTDPGNPRGAWSTAKLLDGLRPQLQQGIPISVPGGKVGMVYTWEGTLVSNGGVNLLILTGADPLNVAHWTDYAIGPTRPGAWGLCETLVNLAGNGAQDIFYSARNGANPNPSEGLFWLERPAIVTDPWPEHIITVEAKDWTRLEAIDAYGEGRKDLVAVYGGEGASDYLKTKPVRIFRESTGWTDETVHGFPLAETFNVFRLPTGANGRDRFCVVLGKDGFYTFTWSGASWVVARVWPCAPHHPVDDRVWLRDIDGDGTVECVAGDSGGNSVRIMRFV